MSQKKSHLVKYIYRYIYHAQALENQKKKKRIEKKKKKKATLMPNVVGLLQLWVGLPPTTLRPKGSR